MFGYYPFAPLYYCSLPLNPSYRLYLPPPQQHTLYIYPSAQLNTHSAHFQRLPPEEPAQIPQIQEMQARESSPKVNIEIKSTSSLNERKREEVQNSVDVHEEEKKVVLKKTKKSIRYKTEKSIYLGKKLPKNIGMESRRLRKKYLPKLRQVKKKSNRYEIYETEIRLSKVQNRVIKKKEKIKYPLLSSKFKERDHWQYVEIEATLPDLYQNPVKLLKSIQDKQTSLLARQCLFERVNHD